MPTLQPQFYTPISKQITLVFEPIGSLDLHVVSDEADQPPDKDQYAAEASNE